MSTEHTGNDHRPLPKTSAPAQRALTAAGISSLDDLATRTEAEVAVLHGMGPKRSASSATPSPNTGCHSGTTFRRLKLVH